MYVNPFIAGIIFTLFVETAIIGFVVIQHVIHNNKEE